MAHFLREFGRASVDAGLGLTSRISPYYWLPTLIVAFVIWRARQPVAREAFLRGLFPTRPGAERSHVVDFALMGIGVVVQATGAVSFAGVAAVFAVLVNDALDGYSLPRAPLSGPWIATAVTVVTAVTADFCTYWVHRVHHRIAVLWPFHELHHSAEVMSPATFYRKHPVYDAIHNLFTAVAGGSLQGLVLSLFIGKPSPFLIGDANALYFLFHLTGSNLRHSHVWLSYGPRLSKWLVSPAMHQIHHSRAPQHRDKNFGEVFAVWDWVFGTLYVPEAREALDFGLSDDEGNALPQPHDGVLAAVFGPFRASAAALSNAVRRRTP